MFSTPPDESGEPSVPAAVTSVVEVAFAALLAELEVDLVASLEVGYHALAFDGRMSPRPADDEPADSERAVGEQEPATDVEEATGPEPEPEVAHEVEAVPTPVEATDSEDEVAAEPDAGVDAGPEPEPEPERVSFTVSADSAEFWAVELGLVEAEAFVVRPAPAVLLAEIAAADRAVRVAEGRRLAAVVAAVGVASSGSSLGERQKAHEVAIALSVSKATGETVVAQARALFGPFAPFGCALLAGAVSVAHCRALIEQTVHVTDPDTLALIADRALPHAYRLVVVEFRRQVDALIAALDPDAVARHRRAREARGVYTVRRRDGMSFLGLTHETPVIDAVYAQILADGRLLAAQREYDLATTAAAQVDPLVADGDPAVGAAIARAADLTGADLGADACRADAFATRVRGQVADDGSVSWDRDGSTAVTVEVVIDLDTLRGLADRVALVNGQPVPAEVGRDAARWATYVRRIVTDPVDGHLLDYGDRSYLPEPLRRFCLARDGGCRSPGCTRRATRLLQLDHAEEYPHGPSSAANTGALCRECHQRKTERLLDITDSRADGTCMFTTAWGQTVHIPPRSYLPDTEPVATAPPVEQDPEPPPF